MHQKKTLFPPQKKIHMKKLSHEIFTPGLFLNLLLLGIYLSIWLLNCCFRVSRYICNSRQIPHIIQRGESQLPVSLADGESNSPCIICSHDSAYRTEHRVDICRADYILAGCQRLIAQSTFEEFQKIQPPLNGTSRQDKKKQSCMKSDI
jgi:hypothetical protein